MRYFFVSMFVLAAICLTFSVQAKGTKTAKSKPISGTISSVAADGGSIVIHTGSKKKTGSDKTLTVNASTSVSINGSSAKVTDLTTGMRVKVTVSGDTASAIAVAPSKSKKKKA